MERGFHLIESFWYLRKAGRNVFPADTRGCLYTWTSVPEELKNEIWLLLSKLSSNCSNSEISNTIAMIAQLLGAKVLFCFYLIMAAVASQAKTGSGRLSLFTAV